MQDALREYRGSLWGHILENCVCEAVTTLEPKPHSRQGESSTLWHSQISLQVALQETLWLLQYRQGRRHELCMSPVLFLCRLLCAKSATNTLNRQQASCPECIRIAILVSWPKFMMQVQANFCSMLLFIFCTAYKCYYKLRVAQWMRMKKWRPQKFIFFIHQSTLKPFRAMLLSQILTKNGQIIFKHPS